MAVLPGVLLAQDAKPDAKEILQKTLETYAKAKTYQGDWTYTYERGAATQKMTMEIKAKGPARLSLRVRLAPGQKPVPAQEAIPETLVVLDGKTAYFENTTAKEYFKVALPKNARVTPVMFFPLIPAASAVRRGDDLQVDGKTFYVLQAEVPNGGATRMEIDTATYRIRRIVEENIIALVKIVSTLAVEKETFDADIRDSAFSYRATKGAKEIPAPPEAAAMFGPK